jgi:GTPase SAR1 family protein
MPSVRVQRTARRTGSGVAAGPAALLAHLARLPSLATGSTAGPIYYRDSNGAVLVYDITDQDSFVKVRRARQAAPLSAPRPVR